MPKKRPRVLYLAFYFPPSRASGVFRALATANHLAAADWDVTVLTAPADFFPRFLGPGSVDPELAATIDPRVAVSRPRMTTYRWKRDLRAYGTLRANLPVLTNAFYNWTQRHLFPEHYAGWLPGVLSQALRRHATRPFDLVLATGNPFASFAAAWALGRTLRIPYVLDYRDAWTFNQFTEQPKFPPGSNAYAWEGRVLRDAAEVVFVNDGMRRHLAAQYPGAADRMTVVPNGWEPQIMNMEEDGDGERADVPSTSPRPLRFGYVGTVTDHLPLEELFAGWRRARTDHPLLADATLDIHGHLGFFPHDADRLRDRLPLAEPGLGVAYRGPVPKPRIGEAYRSLDALVFCVPGARFVTSGKVFEYMATGKPVVSVHHPEIAAAEVLDGYPLHFGGTGLDAASVADSFVAAAKAARDADDAVRSAGRAHAERWTREAVLTPWEQRLRALAGG
jgi:glycosyltransferase involved in cell wall biosynthesis